MAKAKTNYTCSDCGAIASRWTGQCQDCKAWNTMVETVVETAGQNRYSQPQHKSLAQTAPVLSLSDIEEAINAAAMIPATRLLID